jgi:chromosome partitioning protein
MTTDTQRKNPIDLIEMEMADDGRRDCPPTIVPVIGSKGGTLKTTTVRTLAHICAERGCHVVAVDLDPQGSLTLTSGADRVVDPLGAPPVPITYLLPPDAVGVRDEVRVAGSVSLFRGGRALEHATMTQVQSHLARVCHQHRGPRHLVLLDVPPSLAILAQAAMQYATLSLIPSEATRDGVNGIADVLHLHSSLGLTSPLRVVLTKVSGMMKELTERTKGSLRNEPPFSTYPHLTVLQPEIPWNRRGAEASSFELPVTITAQSDRTSIAYRRLATELGRELGNAIPARRARHAELQCAARGGL